MLPIVYWMICNVENSSADDEKIQNWNTSSIALYVFLPVFGLALVLGKRDIFTRLLLQLDRNCVSVFCPSLSKREKLVKWASGRLPLTWSSHSRTLSGGIVDLWTDGSLLCTLLNSAIPGACPNPHRHWKKSPTHAQAIAYKYLGVVPVFTEHDLSGEFTITHERNLLHYVNEIQQAIERLPGKEDKEQKFTSQYLARGMGLYTGEQYTKTVFYIYPNTKTPRKNSNLLIQIRGPYSTYGKAVVPHFQNKKVIPDIKLTSEKLDITKILLEEKPKSTPKPKSFFRALSQEISSLLLPEKKIVTHDIEINIEIEETRAKVSYIPKNYGMYEINLIANGELLRGCPYSVNISNNTTNRRDSFGKSQNFVEIPSTKKRKILSKTINFVNKQLSFNNANKYCYKTNPPKKNRNVEENLPVVLKVNTNEDNKLVNGDNSSSVIKEEDEPSKEVSEDNYWKNEKDPIKNEIENPLEVQKKHEEIPPKEIDNIFENVLEANSVHPSSQQNEIIDEKSKEFSVFEDNHQENLDTSVSFMQSDSNDNLPNGITETDSSEKVFARNKDLFEHINDLSKNLKVESNKPVSKVKIPEKFAAEIIKQPNKRYFGELNSKYFKDVINNSNKAKTDDADLNSGFVLESPSSLSNPETSLTPSETNTSPICPDHIVPEVEPPSFHSLPTAEKRKMFSKLKSENTQMSQNSSFSESENVDSSGKSYGLGELSVMTVLGSLRTTEQGNYSLASTISLPNMSFETDNNFQQVFKEKKDFWERVSSRSSSSLSTSNSDSGWSNRKEKSPSPGLERSKALWRKPSGPPVTDNCSLDQISIIRKSADDILSLTHSTPHHNSKRYKSVDNSLDDCVVLSIEERKKLLLKENYEKETVKNKVYIPKSSKIEDISLNKGEAQVQNKSKEGKNINAVFSSIQDRISKYEESKVPEKNTVKVNNTDKNSNDVNVKSSNYIHNNLNSSAPTTKNLILTQYKRAKKFFKNLEEKALFKPKDKPPIPKQRRFSLDVQSKKNHQKRKGGSLNLPNISERFSINNLYEDVFGGRRGSFKGTPNKTAVVETLSTLKQSQNNNFEISSQVEEDIKYNLFKNNSRVKERRSIKSIFDVNY